MAGYSATSVEAVVIQAGSSDFYYRDRYWNEHPLVIEYLNRRATDVAHPGWIHHLLQHRDGRPFERALILNCGNGWVERDLLQHGVIRSAVGIDILPDLLDQAKTAAEGLALTYRHADINALDADTLDGPFDLVVNHAAAHHIAFIDRVFRQIAALLRPDGTFVSWDYVGPHRNQYPEDLWHAAERVNATLPEPFRCDLRYPHLEGMLRGDPSEAVHSELIVPTMERYFDLDHSRRLGGPIGYLLLTHNPALLDADHEASDPLVQRILEADADLVDADPTTNLFAYIIARPKADGPDPTTLARYAAEEDERERAASANGGQYYPLTPLAKRYHPIGRRARLRRLVRRSLGRSTTKPVD